VGTSGAYQCGGRQFHPATQAITFRCECAGIDVDELTADAGRSNRAEKYDMGLISVLIGVLVIVVVGAICFWAIDKFAADRRLSQLLKLLVVLICLGAILQRVLPLI